MISGLQHLLLLAGIFTFSAISVTGQEKYCDTYRQYPSPGHPVDVVALHPSDKSFSFRTELTKLKLILLEPGICELETKERGWYSGRVFVFKSGSPNFKHGDIIAIEMGRFK